MYYITQTPNPSGAYPAPQSNPAPGLLPLTDEQAAMVVQYNGFVAITSREEEYEDGFFRTVYEVTPDIEAWESWKASLPPEPEPEPTEAQALGQQITAMELESIAQGQRQTALELDLLEQGQYITQKELEGMTHV